MEEMVERRKVGEDTTVVRSFDLIAMRQSSKANAPGALWKRVS